MDEDVIRQADEVRRMINNQEIRFDDKYRPENSDLIDRLTAGVNRLTQIESSEGKEGLAKEASAVVQLFTTLSVNGCTQVNEQKILVQFNSLIQRYNSLNKSYNELVEKKKSEIRALNDEHETKIKEMQKTIEELHEQVGIVEGMYQECAKRIEQIIQVSSLKE